jgi:dynein heavy chain
MPPVLFQVRMTFDQNRKNPPVERRSPKFAGAAQWAMALLHRIKKQFDLLSSSYQVVSTREWQEVKAQEFLISTAISDYIDKAHLDWQKNYNLIFQGGGPHPMDNTLLSREPETQLLMVNFSPDLLRLFREVEVWEVSTPAPPIPRGPPASLVCRRSWVDRFLS